MTERSSPDSELLQEVLETLRHARVFITSRERMHIDGVALYDDAIEHVKAAMERAPAQAAQPYPELVQARDALKVMLSLFDDEGALSCNFSELQQAIWSGYAVLRDTKPDYEIHPAQAMQPTGVDRSAVAEAHEHVSQGIRRMTDSKQVVPIEFNRAAHALHHALNDGKDQ